MYAYYIHTFYYKHTVDTCMTAVHFNVYDYVWCLHNGSWYFDGYTRAVTLINDRLRIALSLITDSGYWN